MSPRHESSTGGLFFHAATTSSGLFVIIDDEDEDMMMYRFLQRAEFIQPKQLSSHEPGNHGDVRLVRRDNFKALMLLIPLVQTQTLLEIYLRCLVTFHATQPVPRLE